MKKFSIILALPSAWSILSEIEVSDLGRAAYSLKFCPEAEAVIVLGFDKYIEKRRENTKAVVALANQAATNQVLV